MSEINLEDLAIQIARNHIVEPDYLGVSEYLGDFLPSEIPDDEFDEAIDEVRARVDGILRGLLERIPRRSDEG